MIKIFPFFLSLSVGYISISQEILWVRVFSFANQTLPQAFSVVLTLYLLGIALGAIVGKAVCLRFSSLYHVSGVILVAGGFFDILAPIVYGHSADSKLGLPVLATAILLTALNKGILFPIVHHLGSNDVGNAVGGKVSRVYFFNVAGATLGPIVTGFVLFDYFSVYTCMLIMAVMTIIVGISCFLIDQTRVKVVIAAGLAIPIVLGVMISAKSFLFGFEELSVQVAHATTCGAAKQTGPVKQIIENKYGIIHICPGDNEDIIFGGNAYDGTTNTNLVVDSNGVTRLALLSALHQRPSKVLMVGLSGGAWLAVLTRVPEIDEIDVVEINPGYLDVVERYPEMSDALMDPRVNLHIDDGRHWLNGHPENKYDLVIMNTTYHWRANATNLLSSDFLSEIKDHLNEDGLIAYNSTSSPDAAFTAASVFSHAYVYKSFIYASDRDFRIGIDSPENREKIARLVASSAPSATSRQIEEVTASLLSSTQFKTVGDIEAIFERQFEVVTDINMITEYKYGKFASYIGRYDDFWSFLKSLIFS